MKTTLIIILLAVFCISACKKTEKSDNPFFNKYDTPFEVPPFEKIKISHFMPAYLKGFEEEIKEIDAIVNNPKEPTFANTIKAMEYTGKLLDKVSGVFGTLSGANTNDSLQALSKQLSPLQSKHRDDISLNPKLFERVKKVFDNKDKFNLTNEEKKLLDDTYKGFVRSGAALSPEDKEKLRKINEELSMLSVQFGENMLAETNDFKLVIDKKEDLSGLPEGVISQAATMAKNLKMEGKWVFTLQVPSWTPFLQYSTRRDLREKLFTGYFMRGDNDNNRDYKTIVAKIAKLRVERSHLLGYKSYADFVLERNMAKTPQKVFDFLSQVWTAATPFAKAEAAAQQEVIKKEGGKFKLEPWDWWYYTEKIRQEKYNLSDEITKPYFKIDNVMEGMFYVANQLYGLNFTKRNDLPKYHPDVETF
jgi:peptidyl-dipeptidase Dcp